MTSLAKKVLVVLGGLVVVTLCAVCFRELVTMTSLPVPHSVTEVPTPSFLVDVDIVRRNAKNMIDRCNSRGLKLRPHMKTHKCL